MHEKHKIFMKLCLFFSLISWSTGVYAQGFVVTGKVTSSGESVIGATVQVKGKITGTITDIDGNYRLTLENSKETLVFSFIGYQSKEVTVNGKNVINVELEEDVAQLEEVVVVGYGTMRKKDLTGAITRISTENTTQSVTSVAEMLRGTVAGFSAGFGTSAKGGGSMLIRGEKSINASNSPLIVLDGVIFNGDLVDINPSDIETIDILKDASSTAIYGSRATNGVVMVTTKRGKIGKVKIDYSGYAGYRKYTNMPDMMSGEEYVQLAREAKRAGNNNEYVDDSKIFTASELKAIQDGNYFDWVDAVSTPAFMTNHTISATGGNEMATYALSAGYYFEDGMLEPQEYSRYNLRAVVDVEPSKYMKFGINMYGTHSVRDTGNSDLLQDAFRLRPTYHPTDLVTGEEMWAYSNGQYNALTTMKNELNKTKKYNLLSNIYLAITPVKGLTLKTTFSPDINLEEIGQYRGKYTKANKGQNKATSNYAKNSYVDWVWDNLVNYNFQLKDHRVD